MSDPATARPAAEPIVDPVPEVITQFDEKWAFQFVRPPLDKDGNRIADADGLKDAFKPDEHQWFQTACHVVTFTMLIHWLANQNPLTKGNLVVPNLDLTKEVTPPHVAFALCRTFVLPSNLSTDLPTSADQTKFVSAADHPPYIPFVPKGKSWEVLHDQIREDFRQLKLKTDKAPDGEPISLLMLPLVLLTPGALAGHVHAKKSLLTERTGVSEKLTANEAEAAALEGKEDNKSKAQLEQLQKTHAKLEKQRDDLDAKLAINPVGDDRQYDPARVKLNREANKTVLKRALLRGPLLVNMKLSPHYILLIGYRGRDMTIIDPGQVIQKQWFGNTEDPATLPARVGADNTNILIVDGEIEFEKVSAKECKIAFLDNLVGCESYFFPSIGDQASYNAVAPLPSRPVEEKDVRRFPKPKEKPKPK